MRRKINTKPENILRLLDFRFLAQSTATESLIFNTIKGAEKKTKQHQNTYEDFPFALNEALWCICHKRNKQNDFIFFRIHYIVSNFTW